MLDWLKRKQEPPADPGAEFREFLFGDVPLDAWAGKGEGEPWDRFRAARDALSRGDRTGAQQSLSAIAELRGLVQVLTQRASAGGGPAPA